MKYEGIQSLRAAAALMVVLHHFLLANIQYGSSKSIAHFYNFSAFGAAGVDLFFCISGFVMMAAVQKEMKNFSFFDFLFRRALRIFPLYWLATLGFVLLVGLSTWQKEGVQVFSSSNLFSINYLLKSFLLLPTLNPQNGEFQPFLAQGWTLSYEFLFYFCLAASVSLMRKNGNLSITAIVFALVIILFYFNSLFPAPWDRFLGHNIIIEFLFGIFSFYLVRHGVVYPRIWVLLGCLGLCSTIFIKDFDRVFLWGVPSALILTGAAISYQPHVLSNLLHRLGDASFSIYLTHGYFTYVYGGLLKRGFSQSALIQDLMALCGVVFSAIFGYIVFKYIEQPILKYLRKPLMSH